jgi:hypothetical protein
MFDVVTGLARLQEPKGATQVQVLAAAYQEPTKCFWWMPLVPIAGRFKALGNPPPLLPLSLSGYRYSQREC